jgi:hypothetical protein
MDDGPISFSVSISGHGISVGVVELKWEKFHVHGILGVRLSRTYRMPYSEVRMPSHLTNVDNLKSHRIHGSILSNPIQNNKIM